MAILVCIPTPALVLSNFLLKYTSLNFYLQSVIHLWNKRLLPINQNRKSTSQLLTLNHNVWKQESPLIHATLVSLLFLSKVRHMPTSGLCTVSGFCLECSSSKQPYGSPLSSSKTLLPSEPTWYCFHFRYFRYHIMLFWCFLSRWNYLFCSQDDLKWFKSNIEIK